VVNNFNLLLLLAHPLSKNIILAILLVAYACFGTSERRLERTQLQLPFLWPFSRQNFIPIIFFVVKIDV
jgi:hypothetical protein